LYRWSAAPLSAKLFGDDQEDKQTSKITRTEPVKKCQRVLKFFNNTESATPKNLFNTKPSQKELSKLHKQVCIYIFAVIIKFETTCLFSCLPNFVASYLCYLPNN